MDHAIAQAKRVGYSKTIFGRRRPIPDLDNSNPNIRGFAERTAINSPIQGSAADLIKLAMPRVEAKLREAKLEALLLLQVHDELLLEVPEAETEKVAELVKHEMENVHSMNVPLVVDVKVGKNWRDMTPAL
jgi:DNA polymerase-1